MRKNIREVLVSWDNGKPRRFPSCSTDGMNIWSYNTVIAQKVGDDVVVDMSYSKTTKTQQRAIAEFLYGLGYRGGDNGLFHRPRPE